MEDLWLKKWNERYKQNTYAYGKKPNNYLKEQLEQLEIGTILFPAEGEGRNAVFAAILGWKVHAFDISIEGKKKALQLAQKSNAQIDYKVGILKSLSYTEKQFDAIALIYAHFPSNIRSKYHKLLSKYLKENGIIILEAFSKSHLQYRLENKEVGGPIDLKNLFSKEEILADFNDYEILELEEKEIELDEGLYHRGKGAVIRFVGRKKSVR